MIPTSIDGTDITGATIDGTDVTEITVDGQTVFTAAPPIPQSVVYEYLYDNFSSGTWQDSAGNEDISTSNVSQINSAFNGNGGLQGGTGSANLDNITVSNLGDFAVSVSYDNLSASAAVTMGFNISGQSLSIRNGDPFGQFSNPVPFVFFKETNTSIQVAPIATVTAPVHLLINVTGDTHNDVEFYIDDMTTPTPVEIDRTGTVDPNAFTLTGDYMGYFARGRDPGFDVNSDVHMRDIRWFDSSLTQSERQNVDDSLVWK